MSIREPDLEALLHGYRLSALLHVAAELDVADRLAGGPRTSGDLARSLDVDHGVLDRILRALAVHGILQCVDGTYALTATGQRMRSDVPDSLHAAAILVGAEYMPAWAALPHTVRTGQTAFDHVFGMSNWEHRNAYPALDSAFNRMIANGTRRASEAIARAHDFGRYGHVVDVGGGSGLLLAFLLARHAGLTGTLFDQPHVTPSAARTLAEATASSRCTIVGGSFFDVVPSGADAYLLKNVLHDWDDARAYRILEVCRLAMTKPGARLLVVERLLPEAGAPSLGTVDMDIHMLAVAGGRERRCDELEQLMRKAGLGLVEVWPIGELGAVLEARRVDRQQL